MKNRKKTKVPVKFDTAEFEREFVADSFKPLSPANKARWERIKKKGSRKGKVTLQVEEELLQHLDGLARKMGVTRESLVQRGIKAVLAAAGKF